MSKFSTRAARGASALTLALGLFLSLIAFPVASSASTRLYQATTPATITVPAGGTATITARGFCLDFGKTFPTGSISATTLVPDNVRAALNYSIQKGYTDTDAQQVQLAIWYLRDNTWHASPHTVADEIVANATAANMPANSTGTSVVEAVSQGKLSATGTLVPQTADAFYGDGQITLTNKGTADVAVYLPIGTTFTNGDASFQSLAVYQLSTPAQATGTVSTTASPAASVTSVITGTASPEASATAVVTGTSTVEPTSTTAAVTSTVATSPTAAETAPTAATAAVETPTAAATETPVAVATDTPAPVVAAATDTATPVVGVLPQTGRDDGFNGLALSILAMGILLTIAGSTALVLSKRRA